MNILTAHFPKHIQWFALLIVLFSSPVIAQDYQWAFTAGKAHHTQPVAIRKDAGGNLYLATFTDSLSAPIYTGVEKRNADQQLLWQKQIDGEAAITDLEINSADHAVVTGYFTGIISIDGNSLASVPGESSGFIFEADEAGSLLWVHAINPLNSRFKPVDLFIADNGIMYLSSEISGTGGLCGFHKLDASGNILKSEFTTSFDNRTFSHIIADTAGNVYLSGTCGNLASFDTIAANPAFSYQNFLIKYDSSFQAKWMIAKNYVTFDNNNKLCTDGKNLYWAYDDYTNVNSDSTKIIRVDYNGQVLSSINTPVAIAFLPAIDYSVDRSGNSIFLLQAFVHMYLYRYDSSFNITWQDTLATQTSGFPLHNTLMCYDSSFYMAGLYITPSLSLNNFTLANPNTGLSYPSDVFVFKWGYFQALPVSLLSFDATEKEEQILLNWRTENEINADRFLIEKSTDGINFKAIGSVEARNRNMNEYQFPDVIRNCTYKILYYRLRQTDKDGHYKLSNVLHVKLNKNLSLKVFPNPAATTLNIEIGATQAENIEIFICSTDGKIIMKNPFRINKGNNLIPFNISKLAEGNYVISIKGPTINENSPFTKQ